MKFKKRGFTLIELQMASILMIVVLIATGVIFYFSLASLRYMHDAVMVYSNVNSAMKTLTDEIMVSNCWGFTQGDPGFARPQYSFYDDTGGGYVHGAITDVVNGTITFPVAALSQSTASSATNFTPIYGNSTAPGALHLRQSPQQGGDTIAGDFPLHDNLAIYIQDQDNDGKFEMYVQPALAGGIINTTVIGANLVAHNVTDFSFWEIAYNCVAVRVTVTGDVPDPFSVNPSMYELTLAKTITLRCAPTVAPFAP